MSYLKILFTILFLVSISISFAASKSASYQFNLNIGQDNPDDGETRTGNAILTKFALSTKPRMFRLVGAFTAASGGGLKQGEFSIGPHIYPLGKINRGFVQPYLYAEGSFGIGSYAEKSRYDTGYGVGVGCDFFFSNNSGMTLAVEQKNATESAYRLWLGFIYQGR